MHTLTHSSGRWGSKRTEMISGFQDLRLRGPRGPSRKFDRRNRSDAPESMDTLGCIVPTEFPNCSSPRRLTAPHVGYPTDPSVMQTTPALTRFHTISFGCRRIPTFLSVPIYKTPPPSLALSCTRRQERWARRNRNHKSSSPLSGPGPHTGASMSQA